MTATLRALWDRPEVQPANRPAGDASPPAYTLLDADLLDIAYRSNEAIVGNIDALNNSVATLVAIPVALLVFAIEKIREFPLILQVLVVVLTVLSVLFSIISFEYGHLVPAVRRSGAERHVQDSFDLRRFLILYQEFGSKAVADTIAQIERTARANAGIRDGKRWLTRLALLAFFVSAAIVIWDRGWGPRVDQPAQTDRPSDAAISCRKVVK